MNENQLFTASMRIGGTVLPAVLAEIFSVLKDSAILDKSSAATIPLGGWCLEPGWEEPGFEQGSILAGEAQPKMVVNQGGSGRCRVRERVWSLPERPQGCPSLMRRPGRRWELGAR